MTRPAPFSVLFDRSRGRPQPLPDRIERLYGPLRLASPRGRPLVVGNCAATVDGVVALDRRGAAGGADITGFDVGDRMLMGLLRAVADVVVVGAGTLRSAPRHLWTPDRAFPPMATAYAELRERLGKPATPWTAVVSGSGRIDPALPVFASGRARSLLVTTRAGARRRSREAAVGGLRIAPAAASGRLGAAAILAALAGAPPRSILYARSDRAGPGLARRLARDGHRVLDLVAYRVVPGPPLGRPARERLLRSGVVIALSPSSVAGVRRRLDRASFAALAGGRRWIAPGERTLRAIRGHGIRGARRARAASVEALCEAVVSGTDP